MGRTFTEKVGMIESVLAVAKEPTTHALLTARGFNVDPLIEGLSQDLVAVNTLSAEQEALRVTFQRKTAEATHILFEADMKASGLIDAMCGVLGKNSVEARNLQKIRSRIRVPRIEHEPPPPIASAQAA